jgi:hypothetical protein
MIHYTITAAILIALIGALVENRKMRKELNESQLSAEALKQTLRCMTRRTMLQHQAQCEASRKGWETRRAKRLGERLPIEGGQV